MGPIREGFPCPESRPDHETCQAITTLTYPKGHGRRTRDLPCPAGRPAQVTARSLARQQRVIGQQCASRCSLTTSSARKPPFLRTENQSPAGGPQAMARRAIVEYIAWYNGTRLHITLGYRSPPNSRRQQDQEGSPPEPSALVMITLSVRAGQPHAPSAPAALSAPQRPSRRGLPTCQPLPGSNAPRSNGRLLGEPAVWIVRQTIPSRHHLLDRANERPSCGSYWRMLTTTPTLRWWLAGLSAGPVVRGPR